MNLGFELEKGKRLGWHFCHDAILRHHPEKVKAGRTYTAKNSRGHRVARATCCGAGLHASPTPRQAFAYVAGNTVSLVLVTGSTNSDGAKFAGVHRKHLWVYTMTEKEVERAHRLSDNHAAFDKFIYGLHAANS